MSAHRETAGRGGHPTPPQPNEELKPVHGGLQFCVTENLNFGARGRCDPLSREIMNESRSVPQNTRQDYGRLISLSSRRYFFGGISHAKARRQLARGLLSECAVEAKSRYRVSARRTIPRLRSGLK
jgi:hypothetical protein